MERQLTFRAPIQQADGGGAFVAVPFDVEAAFGSKRPRVRATIDGEAYRGTLARMGGDHHLLIVLKEIRARIGKQAGDVVEVTVEPDTEPRVVELPDDLAAALRDAPEAEAAYRSLAYTHQREYVGWIVEAKREQTRADRVARTVRMLTEGRKPR